MKRPVAIAGLVALLAGCSGKEAERPGLDPADREALVEEITARVMTQLREERSREARVAAEPEKIALEPPSAQFERPVVAVAPARVAPVPEELAPAPDRSAKVAPAEVEEPDAPRIAPVPPKEPPPRSPPPRSSPSTGEPAQPVKVQANPPEPTPAAPVGVPVEPTSIEVVDLKVSREVDRENRRPVDPGVSFGADVGKLFAYVVAKNPGERDSIIIEWEHDSKTISRLNLNVGHSLAGWRTWSTARVTGQRTGRWIVRVLSSGGAVLATETFEITAPAAPAAPAAP